ncbi:MAG: CsxC family protein [Mobilitalea sp.]
MDNLKLSNASVISSDSHASTDCKTQCAAAVVSADTLPEAENYPWWGGDFKIPKVLAEFVIQIDSESKIRLNEPAYEIKRIEKQIFLTQCRYIPPTSKVFIEGYIRKNIEYATRTCSKNHAIGGSIKDTTVHIPFKAYTKVDFCGNKPHILANPPAMVARYFDEKRMGKDIREADRSNVEIFNEPVYCELEWSAVYDADIDNKGTPIEGFINEEEFQEFTDKSVVYLCMKLLQKQQVCWPDHSAPHVKDAFKSMPYPLDTQWSTPVSELPDRK